MQYIITAYDGDDENALARRMEARPSHLENMQKVKEKGIVVCAGGITDEDGKMKGSFLVLEFENKEDFDNYLKTEPYITQNVWNNVKVECCNVVIMNNERVGK